MSADERGEGAAAGPQAQGDHPRLRVRRAGPEGPAAARVRFHSTPHASPKCNLMHFDSCARIDSSGFTER